MIDNRPPPQNLDAERALLGSMLTGPEWIDEVLNVISADRVTDFYRDDNRKVFQCVAELHQNDAPIDLVSVEADLTARGWMDDVGGREYLLTLSESVPSPSDAAYYAGIVRDRALLRSMISLTQRAHDLCYGPEARPLDMVNLIERETARLRGVVSSDADDEPINQVAERLRPAMLSGTANKAGIATGIGPLDGSLNGMRPGQFIVLAARPGIGKTSLALQIAYRVAASGTGVGFFSLEMSAESLVRRAYSQTLMIPGHKLWKPERLDETERDAIERHRMSPHLILSAPNALTAAEFKVRARRMIARYNVRLLVVDYLGRMKDPGAARHGRTAEITNLSSDVKEAARELGVPILCLHQLNRSAASEKRLPDLHDLRDSGALEQDADVVLMLHPAREREANAPPPAEEGFYLLLRKNREGPVGIWHTTFRRSTTSFLTGAMKADEEEAEEAETVTA